MRNFLLWSFLLLVETTFIRAQTFFLQENFSTASGTTPPTGWTVQTVKGDPVVDIWHFDNPGRQEPGSPIVAPFAIFDSDRYSNNGQAEEVYLISPSFNATTTDKIVLEFDQYFKSGYSGTCAVEVFNGTSWVSVYTNSATTSNPQHSTLDITTIVQNKTNAKIRFKWSGNYSWFWIIDNIKIAVPVITEQFTEQKDITLPRVWYSSVAWGDYDNDSDLDILLTGSINGPGVSKIYRNNGDNTFTELTNIALTGVCYGSIAWGDYDNDGDLDILLTGNSESSSLSSNPVSKIYRNNSDNTFTEQTNISLTPVYHSSVAWGDYDNDGDLDILLTGATGSYPDYNAVSKIYRNNSDNTFTEQSNISLKAVYHSSVAWGDFNNDGFLDILLTGTSNERISKIYQNNGDNSFTEQTSIILTGVTSSSVDWGDYDNDGDLDILLIGFPNSGAVSKIYRNNGDNTFTEQTGIVLPGVQESTAAWGDYDNDGDLDILLTGLSYPANVSISKIYRNNSDNTFTEQTDIALAAMERGSAAWGDYDNDGDLDMILTGSYGWEGAKIYKNNNSRKNTPPIAPSGITARLTNTKLLFSWDKVTDNETSQPGLTYNLRIGTTPGGCEILSPMSLADGALLIPAFGNVEHKTSWTIDLSRFSPLPGKIYYSVQAIDNSFMASKWSPEKSEISNFEAGFLLNTACQKSKTQFQDVSYSLQYPIIKYNWKFTEGSVNNTSSLQNPTYTFQTPGSHQVELTITNSNGESTSHVKTITVLPSPLANFTATNVCQGVPVVLDNTTDANTTTINGWLWDYGDNSANSALEEPGNHGYLNADDYLVELTASATNGCSNSISKTVTVAGYPVAEITTNKPLKFCNGDSVSLSVFYNSYFNYKWLLDGVYITGADSSKYIAKQTGNFAAEVVNTKVNCKTNSSQVAVTVQNTPAAPFIIASGNTTFCQGDSIILSVTNTTGYSYQWSLNGGAVGTNVNQVIVKIAGTYNLVITNSTGCSAASSNSIKVVVNNLPVIGSVNLSGPTQLCEGDSLLMNISATAGYSYQWRNQLGPITGGKTTRYTAKATGEYYLDITNEKGCKISSKPINVNFKTNPPLPVISVENFHPELCNIKTPIVLRVKDPVETYSYQWRRNGIPLNNATQSFIEGLFPQGDYTVVINDNGCKSESLNASIYFENAPKKPLLYVKGPNVWYLVCSNDSAYQYKWYYNDNLINGADKYYYVANRNMGRYYVSIANATGCFTASDVETIPTGITGVDDINLFESLKVYPNPTKGLFTIEMDNDLFGELLVSIITEQGKDILNLKFEKTTEYFSGQIDLSGQAKGLYLINVLIDKHFASRKVILE